MTSSPDLAALLVRVEASETRMKGLRDARNAWGEGYAHGAAEAYGVVAAMLRALLALAGDTSGVEKIDKSSCADSSDAPRFAAAEDAQRKSEWGD